MPGILRYQPWALGACLFVGAALHPIQNAQCPYGFGYGGNETRENVDESCRG